MSPTFDHDWMFRTDARLFDAYGRRIDVAGLPRWSQPEYPTLRHGNHAAVRAGEALIPDQLVQVFDAQRRDGAAVRCIDVYGERDERDALCEQFGLRPSEQSELHVVTIDRDAAPAGVTDDIGDRTAPLPIEVPAREWVDVVTSITHGALPDWAMEVTRAQAVVPNVHFYAIRIGDAAIACVARFDWDDVSQIASLYTDTDFRNTGFARVVLMAAIHRAPNRTVIANYHVRNRIAGVIVKRIGARTVLRDPRRRYIGDWQ